MPPITQITLKRALDKIQLFRGQLDKKFISHRILDGTLHELKVHFIQRSIPSSYCFDLDFITLRFEDDLIVPTALVEIKKEKKKMSENQKNLYLTIAKALDIPFYLLIYLNEDEFKIRRIDKDQLLGYFSYNGLSNWFQELSSLTSPQIIKKRISLKDYY